MQTILLEKSEQKIYSRVIFLISNNMFGIDELFGKKSGQTIQPSLESKKKILVIEDEPEVSDIYTEILKDNGYDVSSAANGEEGLRKIVELSPSLIFLDLRMPVMDGKNMLSRLKNDEEYSKFKNIPVVILTNSGRTDNIRDTVRLGEASEFIIKANITPDQIIDIAKKYVG